MRSTTRSLAIAAGVLLLPAAAATPVLAQAEGDAPPGVTHMHEQTMGGADMARMHGRMMMTGDHAGMARMHHRMVTEQPGARSQPETTP